MSKKVNTQGWGRNIVVASFDAETRTDSADVSALQRQGKQAKLDLTTQFEEAALRATSTQRTQVVSRGVDYESKLSHNPASRRHTCEGLQDRQLIAKSGRMDVLLAEAEQSRGRQIRVRDTAPDLTL